MRSLTVRPCYKGKIRPSNTQNVIVEAQSDEARASRTESIFILKRSF